MEVNAKELIIVAGPNGAGKTTLAEKLAFERSALFLAADKIAAELSPNDPAAARIEAASQFVTQLKSELGRVDTLVVESTLSGKTFRHPDLLILDNQAPRVADFVDRTYQLEVEAAGTGGVACDSRTLVLRALAE